MILANNNIYRNKRNSLEGDDINNILICPIAGNVKPHYLVLKMCFSFPADKNRHGKEILKSSKHIFALPQMTQCTMM